MASSRSALSWLRRHPKMSAIGVVAAVVVAFAGQHAVSPGSGRPDARSTPGASTTLARVRVTPADAEQASTRTAVAALATLQIKGRAPMTGYSRAQFGSSWTDNNNAPGGHNGCDTRNDILRRDLVAITLKPGSNGCTVATGNLRDPYTSQQIVFTRGASTSSAVQIDHVVALGNAWQSGAQAWASTTRVDFANDPLNLLAVDGSANQAKGDSNAASWLPPNKAYRCAYVARQVAVKGRYGLAVTQPEHDAIARILTTCPDQTIPAESGAAAVTPTETGPTPSFSSSPAAPPPVAPAARRDTSRASRQDQMSTAPAGRATAPAMSRDLSP